KKQELIAYRRAREGGEVLSSSDWRSFAMKIEAAWQKAVGSIIETGRLLNEAKDKVNRGDWLKLVKHLPFSERTAQMLMAIAANPILSNPNHGSHLPPSWRTLYELTKLPAEVLVAKIEDHTVNSGMERIHAQVIVEAEKCKHDAEHFRT